MANKTPEEIKKEMAANSAAWGSADAATRKQLEAANQALGAQLGGTFDSGTGKWSDSSGKDLYDYSNLTSTSSPSKSSGSTYTPQGTWNDRDLTGSDKTSVENYQDMWNYYNSIGDQQGMDWAHQQAEDIRSQNGYSGGGDGSDYIGMPQNKPITSIGGGGWSYGPPPTYQDNYSDRIDQMLNDILNRDKFSYDAVNDPLYAQYKEQYNREGERAMKDTMGAVSAKTGGLASSYAASAANQANQYYAQQLADKIPELYQMAYQMYLDDIDLKVQDLGLLNNASNTAYNRFRDTMGDWRADKDFAYGMYRDDIADNKWLTEFNNDNYWKGAYFDRDKFESDRNYNYNVGRDQIADGRYDDETAYNRGENADQKAWERAMTRWQSTGVVQASDAAILGVPAGTAWATAKSGGGSSSSGGGGGGGGKPKLTLAQAQSAAENGQFTDEVKKAIDYYMGDGSFDKFYGVSEDPNLGGGGGAPITSIDGLGDLARNKLNALASMAGSLSNRTPDKEGRYPVENTILIMANDGEITADEAVYMLQYFGYNPGKYFDL